MIKELLSEGAIVSVFDPIAIPNVKKLFGHQISYCNSMKEVLKDSELAIIATEWDEIKTSPLYLYETLMKTPILIDGRNCFSLKEIKKYDIHYISIGRPDIIPVKK
jgi:UDPglucose 6-dehydrogenase